MATYYVSTSGNDNNPGTEAQPWRTVGKAAHSMTAGDITYVRGGTYAESVDFWQSGTKDNYITLKNYTGEVPVVDATGKTAGIIAKSYCEINGLEVKNAKNDGINVWTSAAVRVIGCWIHHNGWNGIAAAGTGSTHHTISGCDCSYNGTAGVSSGGGGCGINLYVTGDHSVIENCDLHHNGIADGQWAAGIEFQGAYVTVTNCRVYNNKLCGINPCRTHDSVVDNCEVYNNANNGIHIDGGTYNTVVHHCVIYGNVTGGGWGAGITIANNAGNANQILNNTIYANTPGVNHGESAGIQFIGTASHGNVVKNNITVGNNKRALYIYDAKTLAEEDYNDWCELNDGKTIYFAGKEYNSLTAYRSASGFSAHSIAADPLFTNAAKRDFTLQANSPCIGKGVDVGQAFVGAAPDMGAKEYTPLKVGNARFGDVPRDLLVPSGYTICVQSDGTWGVSPVNGNGASDGKLGFYGVQAVARPAAGGAAATLSQNGGTPINDTSTFDGYTLGQIVKALRNLGLLT